MRKASVEKRNAPRPLEATLIPKSATCFIPLNVALPNPHGEVFRSPNSTTNESCHIHMAASLPAFDERSTRDSRHKRLERVIPRVCAESHVNNLFFSRQLCI